MAGKRSMLAFICFLLAAAGPSLPGDSGIAAEPRDATIPQRGYSVRVDVNSVFLNVAVYERSTNRSISGLRKEDFLVYEDGVLQKVDQFLPSEAPLNLLLLLDVSGSTGLYLDLMQGASIDFIEKTKPNDRVAIAAFSSRVDLIQDFTSDRTKTEEAIRRIWAGGGTSFYDALMACTDQYMRAAEGRSAIVVFTDGIDNQLEGGYPAGSQTTFDDLYRRIQEAEPVIYPVFLDTVRRSAPTPGAGVGAASRARAPTLDRSKSVPDDSDDESAPYDLAMKQLRMIADQTGGRMYSPRRIEELSGVYSEIANDLRNQYQLGYNPTNAAQDGRWRAITVKIRNRPEAVVRTRKGYYAGKENSRQY